MGSWEKARTWNWQQKMSAEYFCSVFLNWLKAQSHPEKTIISYDKVKIFTRYFSLWFFKTSFAFLCHPEKTRTWYKTCPRSIFLLCIPLMVQNLISPFYWLLTKKKKIIVCKSRRKRTFDNIVCFEPRGSYLARKTGREKNPDKTDIWSNIR